MRNFPVGWGEGEGGGKVGFISRRPLEGSVLSITGYQLCQSMRYDINNAHITNLSVDIAFGTNFNITDVQIRLVTQYHEYTSVNKWDS